MTRDERFKQALAIMETHVELDGVASIRFQDGQIFMFSVDKMLELVDSALTRGSNNALIYVKAGKDVDDPEHNQ
jgi:hypothetical protein